MPASHMYCAVLCCAEDAYYCSLEYGPQDAHTSLGYYNIAKVLQSTGDVAGTPTPCCSNRRTVQSADSCLAQ
jgi:hypothetical protein